MKRINLIYKILICVAGAVVGALIGALIGYYFENLFPTAAKWKQFALLGGIIGFIILLIYFWLIAGRKIILDSVEIPLFTGKVKVTFSEAHRLVGWKIFVETATRISTQSLNQKDGSLREALASLYKLFARSICAPN